MLELSASLGSGEVPFDGGSFRVALPLQSHDLGADAGEVRQASVEALARQDRQLAFGDVCFLLDPSEVEHP